jgi:hypothetical protein
MSSANTPTAFMDFTRNEVNTLFSLLIPTLPEPGRFVYSQAVLCDKGEKGFSEETLPSFKGGSVLGLTRSGRRNWWARLMRSRLKL